MKYLAIIAVVLILVLGALLALRMVRTAHRKKDEWNELKRRANLAESTLSQISNELSLAQTSNMSLDTLILDSIIREYDHKKNNPNVKEIAR